MHTHVSENVGEIQWVKSLFPERKGYLDVYDHYGLLGRRRVLAHGVHLTARERNRVHETGAAVSHCPTSNLFLGSGLFHVHDAKDSRRPMYVGLGTDVGAGTSFSLLATMNEAYKVAELNNYPMTATKSFYLATLGGAEALDLADKIGSIEVGLEADFVVLDPKATPLLEYRAERATSTEELMFVLSIMGDDRAVGLPTSAGRRPTSGGRTDVEDRSRGLRARDHQDVRHPRPRSPRRTRGLDDLGARDDLRRLAVRHPDGVRDRVAGHPGRCAPVDRADRARRLDLHLGVRDVPVLLRLVARPLRHPAVAGHRGRPRHSRCVSLCGHEQFRDPRRCPGRARHRFVVRLRRCGVAAAGGSSRPVTD